MGPWISLHRSTRRRENPPTFSLTTHPRRLILITNNSHTFARHLVAVRRSGSVTPQRTRADETPPDLRPCRVRRRPVVLAFPGRQRRVCRATPESQRRRVQAPQPRHRGAV